MRILHISTNYKPVGVKVGHGGVERVVLWLSEEQTRKGHETAIATHHSSTVLNAIKVFPDNIIELQSTDPRRAEALMDDAYEALFRIVSGGKWDIVHDHMGGFSVFLSRSHSKSRIPLVISCYSQITNKPYTEIYSTLEIVRETFPWATIVASSNSHRSHLSRILLADFTVHLAVPEEELERGEAARAFLNMAIVRPEKQQLELACLAGRHGIPFIFAGPVLRIDSASSAYADSFLAEVGAIVPIEGLSVGEAESAVEAALDRNKSVYVGEVSDPELRTLLFRLATKVVLLNSSDEVFSLVVLESLSRGVPAVAGPFSSAYEALQGFGDVVSGLQPEDIIFALKTRARDRSAIQAFSRSRYSLSKWADTWDAVYLEAFHKFKIINYA